MYKDITSALQARDASQNGGMMNPAGSSLSVAEPPQEVSDELTQSEDDDDDKAVGAPKGASRRPKRRVAPKRLQRACEEILAVKRDLQNKGDLDNFFNIVGKLSIDTLKVLPLVLTDNLIKELARLEAKAEADAKAVAEAAAKARAYAEEKAKEAEAEVEARAKATGQKRNLDDLIQMFEEHSKRMRTMEKWVGELREQISAKSAHLQ